MYLCLYLHATLWMLIKMFMVQLTEQEPSALHALILRLIFANSILWLGEEKHGKNHILSDYSDVKKKQFHVWQTITKSKNNVIQLQFFSKFNYIL